MRGFASEIIRKNQNRMDKIALIDMNGSRKITWSSLLDNICRVAAFAQREGLSGIVPICMDRSMEAFASLLGLNLAGVGVAPLSITTPDARCEIIANQTNNKIWTIDTFNEACKCKPAYEYVESTKIPRPAYVVFTSGSTGTPKGVMLPNEAVVKTMMRAAGPDYFDLTEADNHLHTVSFSFVAIITDVLAPLYAGSSLYVMPEAARGDTRTMEDLVNRFGITSLIVQPQLLRKFEAGPSIRIIVTGSDKVVNIGPKGYKLVNAYGSSETGAFTFHYEIKEPMPVSMVGEPSEGTTYYILDENGNECDEGEICVSGYTAYGYLGMPERTAATFTKNPFSDDPDHQILFHTRDVVRRLPDGEIQYVNRLDNMIKINGQRVEPGEIETLLLDYPGIANAAVKGFTDEETRSILCAYYTSSRELDEDKIKAYLENKLPHYMVPNIYEKLDAMPVNANGKLDRKALQLPDMSRYLEEYEAPANETEKIICDAFAKVLKLEKIGRNDDFFRIGGDSVAALGVASECSSLGITTGDLFAGRTPKSIAILSKDANREMYRNLPSDLEKAALTDSQMNVLLASGMHEKRTVYNISLHFTYGRTQIMTAASVKAAVDSVIRIHPALYADIVEEDSGFYMVRREFPEEGLCTAKEAGDDEITAYARTFIKPIALGDDPLCTVTAWLSSDTVHFFMNMHHIISDGTTVIVLNRQIGEALEGKSPEPEKTDAFALAEAERRIKASTLYSDSKTYFENLLSGVEIDSNLIPDHKAEGSTAAGNMYRDIDASAVEKYLSDKNLTENTFLMGAFGYALAKMTGQSESIFTVAESGRKSHGLENTVSMLVKTLPVVMKIDEEQNAQPILSELQSQFFATMRNNRVGFADLAKEYGIRSDVMFVYQGKMFAGSEDENRRGDIEILEQEEAVCNLSFMIIKNGGVYRIKLEYRREMYEDYTIARFLDLYEKTVAMFISGAPLKEGVLISDADRNFLDAKNDEMRVPQPDGNILDIFAGTVARYPDKTAVICRNVSYTYAEVDKLTDRIAAYIHGKGIGRGDVVSVLIPRGEYMVIATLGVLKAGAAYEPLDPNYPAERLTFMVNDAKSRLLIKDRNLDHILQDYAGDVLYTDEMAGLPEKNCQIEAPEMNDMYVLLYTSGTTGLPKGNMLTHGNLAAFTAAHSRTLELDDTCIMANYASYGFDAHMADIYPAMANGITLVIIPDEMRLDLVEVKNYCERMKVTHLLMTTQVARQFAVQFDYVEHLRCVNCGGEKLVSFEPKQNYRFLNLYGPSECTVCTTGTLVDKYYDNIPIGHVTPNTRAYVTDNYGRRVPVGVPGELILSGPQVGAGYLGREEKTREVFVPNTYEDVAAPYDRCYKSGDIVRYINDGNLEYIGRRDQQVKIRGFRVELEEVEKAIRDYEKIKDATVSVMDNNGAKNICAYIVADERIDIMELNGFIGKSHPSYMIPAVTMQIDRIPMTANGKVDKRNLPKPELQLGELKKPENELQQKIFDKVAEVIGTDQFGIDTDIFMAGVSSIGSIRLCTLLAEEFDVTVKIRDLKRCETVEKLEGWIRKALGIEEPTDVSKANAAVTADTEAAGENEKSEPRAIEYGESHPITKTMEGIFVECISRPDSTVYNIPFLIRIGDAIDVSKLKKAIVAAVEAHPCMKTELFTDENGNICQHRRVGDDYSESEIAELKVDAAEVNDSLIRPFALTGSRLFEISIVHADGTYLLINIHHIISDGTSMGIFIKDIEKAYQGEKPEEEAFSGFDIADEEKASRTKEELDYEKEYYSGLLEGMDKDFLLLPDKFADQPEASGKLIKNQVYASADAVKKYCESNKLGMNAFFVSAFGYMLSKYAGTEYSVFNTIYNGRNDSRIARTVAMTVKTLPVVCNIEKETANDLIRAMSSQLMDSMSNDLFSYAEIAQNFGVKNDVMFIYQGDNFIFDNFCGEKAEEIELDLSEAKAAMSLQVMIKNGELVYELEYDPKRFTEKLMYSLLQAFDMTVAAFADNARLADISMLSAEAIDDMEQYNDTAYDYDKSATIPDHFLAQVEKQPEHLCVEYKGKKLTFKEVGRLSKKLALFLIKEGIGRGDVVAILINRDENMVITAHAAELSGAAYMGLDPTYPPERLEFMLSDSGSGYLIADRNLFDIVKGYEGKVIFIDEIEGLPEVDEKEFNTYRNQENHKAVPDDHALIIYSSGTTGVPKGSILRQRNIVCFFENYKRETELGPDANVATYASFGFDGGAMDVFSAPMSGSALFVIPDDIRLDLSRLEQFFVKNEITNGFMTTQVGCMFISSTKCKTLRHFLVGGEKFVPVTGPEWVNFRNGYGPSETMCYVNLFRVRDTGSFQPIGTVSGNTKEYVIDKYRNRLPYGACGELCIAGGQVGKGYLNRPEKTAESFIQNRFSRAEGYEVMYRTGDVVRMLTDGNYDFVGRRDGQVKIRGFRIELGEIEQQIKKYAGVANAVVKAYDNPAGGKYLAAYIVAGSKLDADKIKDFIGSEKPDYMIPAVIMQVDDIPLNSNGKVDSTRLPKPELGALRKGMEPANETEEKLCEIFGSVLGLDKVYADDDFFKIGGSSISAIQVIVKCEQASFPVVYKNLFANPTPQKLAEFIHGGREEEVNADDLEKGEEYDYSALAYNTVANLPEIDNLGVGDVLLTGATGFLGSHIFRELIDSTSGSVICLVRSKDDLPSDVRFEMIMTYYFEDWYTDEMKARTFIVDGELEDDDIDDKLAGHHFDTIINCAANVKHFAVTEELVSANFSGVENLVALAERTKAKLIQISSLSVCGESVNGSVPDNYIFKETDLNIGQSLENKYVYSKYLGEQAVIDAVSKKKIRGKVIRLGNLMARFEDSEFQVNAGSNAMLRMFLGFKKLGCFPIDMMDAPIEFSPIDDVARAVVLLSGTPDEFTMFHCKNCNEIHYGYLLKAMQDAGCPIDIAEDEIFEEKLKKAMEDPEKATDLGGLVAYRNSTKSAITEGTNRAGDEGVSEESKLRIKIPSSTLFTTKALYRLGFGWPLISMDYLREMVNVLIDLDFFDK